MDGYLEIMSIMLPRRLNWDEFYLRAVYLHLLLQRNVRRMCRGLEAWQIVTNTALCMFAIWLCVEVLRWIFWWLFMQDEGLVSRSKKTAFKIARILPVIKDKIKTELNGKKAELENEVGKQRKGETYTTKLPKVGLPKDKLLMDVDGYQKLGKISWEMGSGVVYHGGKNLTEIQTEVFSKFLWSNPLHPDIFPGVRKMEAEVIQMCVCFFNGGEDACGTMTASGTNSVLLACKTYRDWGRDVKGITKPEIVVSDSAHAAFEKAAEYFKVKIVKVPVSEKKRTVNIKAMRKAITRNTVMLVGSAPEFPSGIVDNIEKIAELGKKYNIGVHVDACLGGFVLAFMKAAGFKVPSYDFSVDGVTSISADAHKYGYAPKGSSIILYQSHSLRHYQYHTCTEWTGGIYATPTILGSRPGVLIAQCWATMMHLGKSGYVDATKRIVKTTRIIRDGLRQAKGVFVFGEPEICVVAFGSKQFDIFALGDELAARDWKLNALQFPSSLHICVTLPMTKSGIAEKFLRDVRECSNKILKNPDWRTTGACLGYIMSCADMKPSSLTAHFAAFLTGNTRIPVAFLQLCYPTLTSFQGAIYGMAQKIPDRSMVRELANHYLDCLYSTKIQSSENGI